MSRSEEASDTLNLSSSRDPPRYTRPPMIPMSMACQGSTVAHPAVIETRPARIPLLSAPVVVRTGMTDRTWLTTCANRDLAKGQAGAIGQDTHRGPRCDRVSW